MKFFNIKQISSSILLVAIFAMWTHGAIAGPPPGSAPPGAAPPGGAGPGGQPCWATGTCIPIDGGIGLLIAAGLGIGGKKLYDARRKA